MITGHKYKKHFEETNKARTPNSHQVSNISFFLIRLSLNEVSGSFGSLLIVFPFMRETKKKIFILKIDMRV